MNTTISGCRSYLPMIKPEARPPVGRAQKGLQTAGQVHESITQQEEPAANKGHVTALTYAKHNARPVGCWSFTSLQHLRLHQDGY